MRILVVDDDTRLTEMLQLVFESRGFGVTIANNGEQALESLGRELPEAILLDLMMPGMSGLEVCRLVRANPRTSNIPIVILTARFDAEMKREVMEAGATEYLTKPLRPSELINCIREVVIHSAVPVKVLT
jgi:two-component system alkaline phosphatase synthesis response regulator PhoP